MTLAAPALHSRTIDVITSWLTGRTERRRSERELAKAVKAFTRC